ncbi:MAG TPA: PadR family transcriptional regulator, partial [Solirubrobacteraceae bacterium]|nr:PadR family transcriptional regulator [Solirubrobacteraceae bacterium]
IATTLRRQHKDEAIKLNYGSLYSVVCALERRGLIAARETEREGRLPERTIYRLTPAGRVEAHDWLAELLAVPAKDYPSFAAALSFLPGVRPQEAIALLEERAGRLEAIIAAHDVVRKMLEQRGLPEVLWIEAEFAVELRRAELGFVRRLIDRVAGAAIGGFELWQGWHDGTAAVPDFALSSGGRE